jgi:hypothetical protein
MSQQAGVSQAAISLPLKRRFEARLDTRGMLTSDWIVVHVICWPTLSIGATDEV